jgi:hypothetical protein
MVIREGRYRTPDRRGQIRMHEALKQRLKDCPVHVPRSEVEAMGEELGLGGSRLPGFSTDSRASRGRAPTLGRTTTGSPPG